MAHPKSVRTNINGQIQGQVQQAQLLVTTQPWIYCQLVEIIATLCTLLL